MRLLELFAGTGSVGKVFRAGWFQVTSLDITGSPDIREDIMTWDYKSIPPGTFQVVWASPPCTMFSRARTTAKTKRDLVGADAMVSRALEIIDWFQPQVWCLENPQTGLLKDREVVAGLPFKDVTYCKYSSGGAHQYKKPTRVWNNLGDYWTPREMCSRGAPCEHMVGTRHPVSAQRRAGRPGDRPFSRAELYSIPPDLVSELLEATLRRLLATTGLEPLEP